ncbi:hypothetical protein [Nostoc sp.]|uniref:hypothetical protein n=1 Tax=Nostoc sp. TaxID=1180 RepID=UPI002FF8F858
MLNRRHQLNLPISSLNQPTFRKYNKTFLFLMAGNDTSFSIGRHPSPNAENPYRDSRHQLKL